MIKKTLLLAEDDEDHAHLIQKALTTSSSIFDVIFWMKNGQEVIDFLNKKGNFIDNKDPIPDLIILDVKMPLMDGFEVLELIKSDSRFKIIPVIMLTTASTSENVKRALELGANDYIVKPIKFSDLAMKVNNISYYWSQTSNSNLDD